ncbi:hypothetical protein BJ875DRAFT_537007 [Amylocarpus encephaloides]|uniref:Tyrosinase copper-binding domain-containing protein n=1 Tax=Amylocarpus encephaloides TaxID=45428 RepID=A0A9P7YCU3_9HELO|nr:hypothetical protein BJ875DRAFT_537007 [Amylocarpus encephaloides]
MVAIKDLLVPLSTLSALLSTSLAAPATEAPATCTNPVLRKEWSAATAAERSSYLKAVLCLATKPSRIGLPTTLYDDFSYIHNQLNLHIHGVAQFLPWHRYFIHVYEAALKDCGYTGVAMYWDWAKASAAPASDPVWSLTAGFGGNGNTSTPNVPMSRCIDGPLKTLRPTYYGETVRSHCVLRDFVAAIPQADPPLQEMIGWQYSQEVIDGILSSNPTFFTFHSALEGGPHGVVHAGIAGWSNGDMGPLTSPNDPIFFLHHTMVDRVWWQWQQGNPGARTNDFSGNEFGDVPGTLDTVMLMNSLAPNRKVGDFMSTKTGDLCYRY